MSSASVWRTSPLTTGPTFPVGSCMRVVATKRTCWHCADEGGLSLLGQYRRRGHLTVLSDTPGPRTGYQELEPFWGGRSSAAEGFGGRG